MVAPQRYSPPVTVHRRRRRRESLGKPALIRGTAIALTVVSTLMVYCSLQAFISKQGYERERIAEQLVSLEATNAALRVKVESLQAPERLRAWALKRGYKVRDRVEYVRLRGSGAVGEPRQMVALRPHPLR